MDQDYESQILFLAWGQLGSGQRSEIDDILFNPSALGYTTTPCVLKD